MNSRAQAKKEEKEEEVKLKIPGFGKKKAAEKVVGDLKDKLSEEDKKEILQKPLKKEVEKSLEDTSMSNGIK